MISATFNLNFQDIKVNMFDRVMSDVERMQRKNTEILAAQCRKIWQNSMKKVAKLSKKKKAGLKMGLGGALYSQPGQPPLAITELFKKYIMYAWNPSTRSAFVGPVKLNLRGTVTRSLELGLPTLIETGFKPKRKVIEVPMQARPSGVPALAKVMEPANLKKVYEKSLKARKGF